MQINRRDAMKLAGGAAAFTGLGFDASAAEVYAKDLRIKGAKETYSVCCFCSVGCGLLVNSSDGKIINVEGDPKHPINEGSLCPKGISIGAVVNTDERVLKPRYRRPGGAEWEEVEWDWAIDRIARLVKDTRDRSFKKTVTSKTREQIDPDAGEDAILYPDIITDEQREFVVNRTDAIAQIGSAALDNEECYVLQKLMRSWGLVHIEHQARI